MGLRIRLRRMGRKKAPHYRIVVAESTMPRDGRFVATIGHYNPTTSPATLKVDSKKATEWLAKGAQPTDTVRSLLRKAGVSPVASASVSLVHSREYMVDATPEHAVITEELLTQIDASPDELISVLGLTIADIDRVSEHFDKFLSQEDREALSSLRTAAERSRPRADATSPEGPQHPVVPSFVTSSA